ncbi:uncharacterized protein LOC143041384 [Oratosquilla oratoria]|uniref:uncharacterized protein LOC143041384 n=1 Tax=Oratosquilla oratoria TaxID=337810 RepID=UPI003F765973
MRTFESVNNDGDDDDDGDNDDGDRDSGDSVGENGSSKGDVNPVCCGRLGLQGDTTGTQSAVPERTRNEVFGDSKNRNFGEFGDTKNRYFGEFEEEEEEQGRRGRDLGSLVTDRQQGGDAVAQGGGSGGGPIDGGGGGGGEGGEGGLYTGPFFAMAQARNVTVHRGSYAKLPCTVRQLQDNIVSWVRQRDADILTVGRYTFVSDKRFSVEVSGDSETWTLVIKNVGSDDEGFYECQVSTEPKRSLRFALQIMVTGECKNVGSDDEGFYECQVSTEPCKSWVSVKEMFLRFNLQVTGECYERKLRIALQIMGKCYEHILRFPLQIMGKCYGDVLRFNLQVTGECYEHKLKFNIQVMDEYYEHKLKFNPQGRGNGP